MCWLHRGVTSQDFKQHSPAFASPLSSAQRPDATPLAQTSRAVQVHGEQVPGLTRLVPMPPPASALSRTHILFCKVFYLLLINLYNRDEVAAATISSCLTACSFKTRTFVLRKALVKHCVTIQNLGRTHTLQPHILCHQIQKVAFGELILNASFTLLLKQPRRSHVRQLNIAFYKVLNIHFSRLPLRFPQ